MKKNKEPNSISSRRDFCKTTVVASSGILAAGLPVGASAYAAGSDKLKVALVGCGGRGTGAAIQAISADENVQLVAVADAFQDRMEDCLSNVNQKFGGDKKKINVPDKNKFVGFDGYKGAIDQADVVILTTPPGFRPIHFEYAVNQGKHLFIEKPLATDAPGIRKVLAAGKLAKEKKLNVVVGLQRHYQKNYKAVIERIRKGAMGDIVSGQVYWNSAGVWVRPRKPGQTEMEYQMRNWYYFNWLCGDHILEQHIHNIDVANWFLDSYPVSAQGMGGREVRTGKDHGEIFDHHFVEFVYPNGAVISSQCRHQPSTMSRVSEHFQGTKGTADTNSDHHGLIKGYGGETIYDHQGKDDPNPYQVEHDQLFAAIRAGKVIDNLEYGAKSTMTAIMGRMATYSGQVIQWEEAMNSEMSIMPQTFAFDADPPVMPDANGYYPIPVPGQTKVL